MAAYIGPCKFHFFFFFFLLYCVEALEIFAVWGPCSGWAGGCTWLGCSRESRGDLIVWSWSRRKRDGKGCERKTEIATETE